MVEFNKMFVMLPVMFLARKLDSEDPNVVFYLRVAYACLQTINLLVVVYTYLKASAVKADRVIYVPPAPVPFGMDANAKTKYTEIAYNAHVLATARSLLGSTLFGCCLTVGLHIYKGMVMGLAIQTVMGPLNLFENPLIKALFMKNGFAPQDRIFDEKYLAELGENDEVVDEQGSPVVRRVAAETTSGEKKEPKNMEDLLLDTWDAGSKAELGPLMAALTKKNCNYQTKEDQWTPLMILAGLGAKGTASALRQVVNDLGANAALKDKEGWNAMHWAAFHGSEEGARELCQLCASLLSETDKEGLTPLETAKKEKNDSVAVILEQATGAKKSQ